MVFNLKIFNLIIDNINTISLAVVSIITALSPIFVAFITNAHNEKMKNLEMYEKAKQDALKHFIDSCSVYFSVNSNEKLRIEALSAMHTLLIYFNIDDTLQNTILEAINNRKHKLLHYAIKELTMQIQKK